MKTKLVYVLTSDEQDYYLEMTYLSVYSARLHNPDAHIALVTDTFTMQTCQDGLRKDLLGFFDEIKDVDASAYDSKQKRSRFLKTSLRNQIDGDYLFIDSDTIVCDSLAEIDNIKGPIAMVRDRHLAREVLLLARTDVIRTFGIDLPVKVYFNSGVMFVRDCEEARILLSQWHNNWENVKDSAEQNLDQKHFHKALLQTAIPITELNGVWNCQLWGGFLPYLHKAKIIHTSYMRDIYLLADKKVLQDLREQNGISDTIKALIDHPKEAFSTAECVISDRDRKIIYSDDYHNFSLLYYKSKRMFHSVGKYAAFLLKVKWHLKKSYTK